MLNLKRGPLRGRAILPYKVNYINSRPPGHFESPINSLNLVTTVKAPAVGASGA